MDFPSSEQWIYALWVLFGLYWFISALKVKKTKQRATWSQRLRYGLPLLVAFFLLTRPQARVGWLEAHFVPATPWVASLGVLLTAAGAAVSLWARWHLGSNWSGVVTLKEGHELIRNGPYRVIRHPIYTGILLALFGTVLAMGEVRGLLALAIAWLSFYEKARREESFLVHEFGEKFEAHVKQTGMFLPKIAHG